MTPEIDRPALSGESCLRQGNGNSLPQADQSPEYFPRAHETPTGELPEALDQLHLTPRMAQIAVVESYDQMSCRQIFHQLRVGKLSLEEFCSVSSASAMSRSQLRQLTRIYEAITEGEMTFGDYRRAVRDLRYGGLRFD